MPTVQPRRHWPALPKYVSTDHDPLLRFHRWRANLRVREIEDVKSVAHSPVSHPFVERLIGTIRRKYLGHVFFWNAADLARKLEAFRVYYDGHRVHRALAGLTPAQRAGALGPALNHYGLAAALPGPVRTPDRCLTTISPPTASNQGLVHLREQRSISSITDTPVRLARHHPVGADLARCAHRPGQLLDV